MTRPRCIDAFCGAGGMGLGLATAGFDLLLSFDNDPRCIETLDANGAGHRAICESIENLSHGQLRRRLGLACGELDLLAGGPPCQGFSAQRTVGGDHDQRNLLVHAYGDLVLDLLPRYFVMENVPGIEGRRGEAILAAFRRRVDAHYETDQRTLDAREFGVPQRRRRVFVLGRRRDEAGRPDQPFPWPRPSRRPPPTVRQTIGHLPPPPDDFSDHADHPGHRADRLSETNKARLAALVAGQGRTDLPEHLLAACHRLSADVVGHRNVYGRMAWDEPAPTITARFDSFTRGQFGHPDQTRTISLHEGALLQTFPPDYVFIGSKVEKARQIGNAVPPLLASALGAALRKAMEHGR